MILAFSRNIISKMVSTGVMNKKSLIHWDICNDLKSGKTIETVSETHKLSVTQVWRIKQCKCPD